MVTVARVLDAGSVMCERVPLVGGKFLEGFGSSGHLY
jgi:hypothetical protein